MTIRVLPELNAPRSRFPLQFDPSPRTLQRYEEGIRFAAADADENVIQLFGSIGSQWWADVSPAMIANRLSAFGDEAVTVHLNSPGGDFFDGQAIYNLFRMHKGQVTMKVLGVAASAASVVAMAGDKIMMPEASWLMIHNTWTVAIGDRQAFAAIIVDLAKFDDVSADLYAARSGSKKSDIVSMMDAETFLSGADAVKKGFADSLLAIEKVSSAATDTSQSALRRIEQGLQAGGMTRGDRRSLLREFKESVGTPRAPEEGGTPRAVQIDPEAIRALTDGLSAFRGGK